MHFQCIVSKNYQGGLRVNKAMLFMSGLAIIALTSYTYGYLPASSDEVAVSSSVIRKECSEGNLVKNCLDAILFS